MAYNSTSWTPDTLTKASNLTSTSNDVTISGSLTTDNIRIDGNTVSSTDTNGDINLTPNGSGKVVLPSTITTTSGYSGDITLEGADITLGNSSSEVFIPGGFTTDVGGYIRTGNLQVGTGGDSSRIGTQGDNDLIELSSNLVTVNGAITAVGDVNFSTATTNTVDFYAAADSVSSGTGTVKMGNSNAANSAGWILVKVGGASKYIPFWTTSSPSP